ncbi:NTF2-related export protein 2-like [Littorina saxatilis]|uniref:NTF2-related export protein n=1 Tax=Littorina saxatilis TaxID=31220 RepID=A0AAN9B285_9CAEN
MAPPEPELKDKAEQADQAAKAFSDLYYEYFDKKRHAIKNLYHDSANLIWNGRAVSGKDAIVKFLEELPTSYTNLSSLDSQPVTESAFEGQTTVVVSTFGLVKYQDNKTQSFYQTFILSSQANVWKIVSDNYRFLEASSGAGT